MGVPAFFRWISEKYPKILAEMLEQKTRYINGHPHPPDTSQANPNGVEFDNLYIDMNGIIHPCSHPEDRPAPTSEIEMYANVMEYVDRLFNAVRPRRLLFMAIDGVAPRAKMNQQRSRRFRAAQDAEERKQVMDEVKQEMRSMGLPTPDDDHEAWDSNVITPGTEFMDKLAVYLEYYILDRMNRFKAWRNVTVILSDASEPGEGEHKIMSFIRRQRTLPDYDPNQWHVLHGLDADLIMLALATHEAKFSILREEVLFGRQQRDRQVSQAQAMLDAQAAGEEKVEVGAERDTPSTSWVYNKPLQILHTHILREYLAGEFSPLQSGVLPFEYSLDRVIDDFVFLCFFVGNDFLPHLPSLDIRDGAIDFLIETYKQMLPSLGGYLTHGAGEVNLSRVDVILGKVGEIEDIVFRMRREAEVREQERRERNQRFQDPRKERGREGAALLAHSQAAGTIVSVADKQASTWAGTHTRFYDDADKSATHVDIMHRTFLGHADVKKVTDAAASGTKQENVDAAARLRQQLQQKEIPMADEAAPVAGAKRVHSDLIESKQNDTNGADHEGAPGEMELSESLDGSAPPLKMVRSEQDEAPGVNAGLQDEDAGEVNNQQQVTMETEIVEAKVEETLETASMKVGDESNAQVTDDNATAAAEDDGAKELKDRMKAKQNERIDKYRTEIQDNIRFHEDGWKDRYYQDDHKRQNIEEGGGKERMIQTYVEGLCWVFKYYYDGCPSWNWYYPFHYAPFASDLVNIDRFEIKFEQSQPFKPIEQLLAVLPPASAKALPTPCRPLMLEASSPIADFYPSEIVLDPNGKAMPWLWVTLLPFIDEGRLKDAITTVYDQFNDEEKLRNSFGYSHAFIHSSNPLTQTAKLAELNGVTTVLQNEDDVDIATVSMHGDPQVDFTASEGTHYGGKLFPASARFRVAVGQPLRMPSSVDEQLSDAENNAVYVFGYDLPAYAPHDPNLLANVAETMPVLEALDLMPRRPPRLNRGRYHILDIANDHQRMSNAGPMRYEQGVASSQRMIVNSIQSGYYDNQRGGGSYHAQQYNYQRTDYHDRGGDPRDRYPRHQGPPPQQYYPQHPPSGGRPPYGQPYQEPRQHQQQAYHHAPPAHSQQPYYRGEPPQAQQQPYYPRPPAPQQYEQPRQYQNYPQQGRTQPPPQQAPPASHYQHRAPPPQQQQRPQGFSFQAQQSQRPAGPPAGSVPDLASLTAQLADTLRRNQQPPPQAGGPPQHPPQHSGGYQHQHPHPGQQYGRGGGGGRGPRPPYDPRNSRRGRY